MLRGSLTYKDYADLYNKGQIINSNFLKSQIQPSSVDLTLSEECYEINASFLSSRTNVRDKLSFQYSNFPISSGFLPSSIFVFNY